MQPNDLDRPYARDTTLADRIHRNLRGVIVAVVLTVTAVAVLVGHYTM